MCHQLYRDFQDLQDLMESLVCQETQVYRDHQVTRPTLG